MTDNSFADLVSAYRVAKRAAEPYQEENSRKYSKIPTPVLEKLFNAVHVVLQEELNI
jgi:hypothetical protein